MALPAFTRQHTNDSISIRVKACPLRTGFLSCDVLKDAPAASSTCLEALLVFQNDTDTMHHLARQPTHFHTWLTHAFAPSREPERGIMQP